MNTNSTYTIEHDSKGTIYKGLTFSEVRSKTFAILSCRNFDRTYLADYIVIDEATKEKMPMSNILV